MANPIKTLVQDYEWIHPVLGSRCTKPLLWRSGRNRMGTCFA